MGELHLIRVERNRRTEMEAFLSGLNLSMLNRANDDPRIPYKAMSEQELIRELDEGYSTYILNEDEEVVGGGTIRWDYLGTTRYTELRHIWINPGKQGHGYGKKLIHALEDIVLQNERITAIFVSVASCYIPAIKLYEKCGFKRQAIFANVPNSYYFVRMVKVYDENILSILRRSFIYAITKIKFSILFYDDSSPKPLHQLLYGIRK